MYKAVESWRLEELRLIGSGLKQRTIVRERSENVPYEMETEPIEGEKRNGNRAKEEGWIRGTAVRDRLPSATEETARN